MLDDITPPVCKYEFGISQVHAILDFSNLEPTPEARSTALWHNQPATYAIGLEGYLCDLPVIGDGAHHGFAVGSLEVELVDILGVCVNYPVEVSWSARGT
jgi:hypothetical protein